jgi:hypothetical protein
MENWIAVGIGGTRGIGLAIAISFVTGVTLDVNGGAFMIYYLHHR